MQTKIARQLIRFTLLVLILQFLSPAFMQPGTPINATGSLLCYDNQKSDANPGLLFYLNENNCEEKEKEGEKENLLSLEIVDFSCIAEALTSDHTHSFHYLPAAVTSLRSLHKLNCTLII